MTSCRWRSAASPAHASSCCRSKSALPRPPEAERKKEDAAQTAPGPVRQRRARGTAQRELLRARRAIDRRRRNRLDRGQRAVVRRKVIAPRLVRTRRCARGTALGDTALIRKSLSSGILGIGLAIALSTLIGFVWPFQLVSREPPARRTSRWNRSQALASGAQPCSTTRPREPRGGYPRQLAPSRGGRRLAARSRRNTTTACRSRPPARGKRGMRQPCEQGRVPSERDTTWTWWQREMAKNDDRLAVSSSARAPRCVFRGKPVALAGAYRPARFGLTILSQRRCSPSAWRHLLLRRPGRATART